MIRRRLPALVLVIALLVAARPAAAQAPPEADQVTAALNAWRLEQDLWPLKRSDTLDALAEAQASYLLTLPDLPNSGDIHLGASGEQPPDRARQAPYRWPSYSRPDQIAITEIAYVGRSAAAAVGYWQGSAIHSRAALNTTYREVGVAALPHRFGYLYIVVLGARPNVLPVQIDEAAGLLYLTDERYRWATGDRWIHDAAEVRFFDGEGRPLGSGWQPWQRIMPLPQNFGERLFVETTDGTVTVLTEVRPGRDDALLPEAFASAIATPTPVPTATHPASSSSGSRSPTRTPASAARTTATPIPSATPAQTSTDEADVTLIYDLRSLTLRNTGNQPIDVRGVVLVQGDQELAVEDWQTPYLSGSLSALPAADCLQVWSWNEASDPAAPPDCRYRRGVINVAPEARFWREAPFEVQRGGVVLATCDAAPNTCRFALP